MTGHAKATAMTGQLNSYGSTKNAPCDARAPAPHTRSCTHRRGGLGGQIGGSVSRQAAELPALRRRTISQGRAVESGDADLRDRAQTVLDLHTTPEILISANVWDVSSAQVVASVAGVLALATASHAISAAFGYEDGENIPPRPAPGHGGAHHAGHGPAGLWTSRPVTATRGDGSSSHRCRRRRREPGRSRWTTGGGGGGGRSGHGRGTRRRDRVRPQCTHRRVRAPGEGCGPQEADARSGAPRTGLPRGGRAGRVRAGGHDARRDRGPRR